MVRIHADCSVGPRDEPHRATSARMRDIRWFETLGEVLPRRGTCAPFRKGAEGAAEDALVRVVDVAADDEADARAGDARAQLVGGAAHGGELPKHDSHLGKTRIELSIVRQY